MPKRFSFYAGLLLLHLSSAFWLDDVIPFHGGPACSQFPWLATYTVLYIGFFGFVINTASVYFLVEKLRERRRRQLAVIEDVMES